MAAVVEEVVERAKGPVRPAVDMQEVLAYRLGRARQEMRAQNVVLAVLQNPVSQRYVSEHRQFSIFQARLPYSYLFLPLEGPLVMHGTYRNSESAIAAFRPARFRNHFDAGLDLTDEGRRLAEEIKGFLSDLGVHDPHPRIACDKLNPSAAGALLQAGFDLVDAETLIERARLIKSADEIQLMRYAIEVAEFGMAAMQEALAPGITENQLLAQLHYTNVAFDGDWFECRILASGHRTNPWYREASDKVIEAGELVAFDTDMIGPNGYSADISRTWICGEAAPSDWQRGLYRHAYDEIQHNIALVRPGMSFLELSQRAFRRRGDCIAHRYTCLAHGLGMSDEYPKIPYQEDWASTGYDGVIEPGMVLCIESFTGSDRGGEGVKLEEVVAVTESGTTLLSSFPFDERLLA